ncbi:hypothetical protein [Paraclostridium sordellii]|uniref:hypothetical protein n=1 Tax=Paraclostridium sordellii TaxID=1505 RepID=UPI000C78C545|nr:hypothetical protein [Paeniclostridium sordellii]AUN12778.1 hypothetical protein RSJ16_00105 [Paeniclostridium sordellii]
MELKDFSHLYEYRPNYMHYIKDEYDIGILASGQKISDIYYILNMGKINLEIYVNDEYIEENKEDENMYKFMKSTNLFNALSYYNYALDYSWQVVYFYASNNNTLDLIYDNLYEKFSKYCNKSEINEILNFSKSLAEKDKKNNIDFLIKHIDSFLSNENTEYIRKMYNYLKHRGMIYTSELYNDSNHLPISVEGQKLKKLYTRYIDPDNLFKKLCQYHNAFINYIDVIINKIIPEGYTEKKSANFNEIVKFVNSHQNSMKK